MKFGKSKPAAMPKVKPPKESKSPKGMRGTLVAAKRPGGMKCGGKVK